MPLGLITHLLIERNLEKVIFILSQVLNGIYISISQNILMNYRTSMKPPSKFLHMFQHQNPMLPCSTKTRVDMEHPVKITSSILTKELILTKIILGVLLVSFSGEKKGGGAPPSLSQIAAFGF